MKKIMITMAALLLMGSMLPANAQQRRRTTTTRRTTSQTQNRLPAKQQKVIKEVALYDVNIKDYCVVDDYIYYIESGDNNAVMKIDRKSGEVETFIPGIANVYEGRRPLFYSIAYTAGRFIFGYGNEQVGIYVDGKLKGNPEWESLKSIGGKYALIYRHDNGYDLVNVERMTLVYQDVTFEGSNGGIFIDANGNAWWLTTYEGRLGVNCQTVDKQLKHYTLKKESYIASEGIDKIDWMTRKGNYLYVSCHRRIYRMNMLQPGQWEEYAKVPPTMDYSFTKFWVNNRGDFVSYNGNTWKECVQYFCAGAFDKPFPMGRGKAIETGIDKFNFSEIWVSNHVVSSDADNNFISSGGDGIRIFNPNGVVGYEKARGKIIKP